MEVPLESAADEVTRLRDCLNDLVSITALPALSTGGEPGQILSTLLDALLGMLRLSFVFVRLNDPEAGDSIQIVRLAESLEGTARAREISEAIDSSLGDAPLNRPPHVRVIIGDVDLSVASAHLGLQGQNGLVVAGSERRDFPSETERLLLDVTANQAAIGLQHARLLSEQKRLEELAQRRRTEEAQREGERESRLIVDSIPGLVALLTATGDVEVVNRQVFEYFGQTLEELRQWGTNDTIHPEDLPQVIEVFTRAITSGSSYEIVQRFRRSDGVYRWFSNSGFPLRDANGHIVRWCVLLTDIDDLKRAEAELRRAYDHLAEAQRLSQTGSFTSDLATDEHCWSEEFYRICEFEPGSKVTIQRLGDIVHPEDVPLYEGAIQRAIAGTEPVFHFRIVTSRGVVKHLRGFAHRIADRPVFVGAVQDVTASRVAEDALNKARSELAHVARVATLSTLTASIAHELNQPLSGIITNAGTCLRMLDANPPNVEGARETARRTIRDGNRASEVVALLRALFSKKEFALEPVDLNEAAQEVLALSFSELQRNRLIVQSELADDLPSIIGDRVQLQQVLLNLLRNASDAMVGVHDRPRQLLIRTEREDGDRVRVTVRDAGTGFDRQSMDNLFEAFYTTKSDGMGIGLSVSRSIVERHHGRLWAEPNDGPGATFSFSIPRGPDSGTDAAPLMRHS
jgi:PAS domain S-box-containing protein